MVAVAGSMAFGMTVVFADQYLVVSLLVVVKVIDL